MFGNWIKTITMTTIAVGTSAAALAGILRPVATVEGIKSYELENGLKVVLFADASKATATVNTTYLVG